jgi:hypothetical protein
MIYQQITHSDRARSKQGKIKMLLLKIFWVATRRHFLEHYQRFGITCLSYLQGLRKKGCQVVRNICLYRSRVQWAVLNGRANQEEGGGVVCCDTFWQGLGQTSDPETLVIHQETTPGNNPEDFKQHYDHGGRLQLHIAKIVLYNCSSERQCFILYYFILFYFYYPSRKAAFF